MAGPSDRDHLCGPYLCGRVADGVGPVAVELGAGGQGLKGCGLGLETTGELAALDRQEPSALDLGGGDLEGHVSGALMSLL